MRKPLEEMTSRELERLISDAREELRRRELEKKLRRRRERAEGVGEGGRWLEHERVNCGKCKRCKEGGYHHGPYWYLYEYTGGKMKSRYAGRRLFEEAAGLLGQQDLAGKKPEEVHPEEYDSTAPFAASSPQHRE